MGQVLHGSARTTERLSWRNPEPGAPLPVGTDAQVRDVPPFRHAALSPLRLAERWIG